MVGSRLFETLAIEWPAAPDADLEEEIRTMPASLLNWLVVGVLNGEATPVNAKSWVEEALAEAKQKRKGDLVFWRLLRWTSLAAAQELMGDFGEQAAREAVDWVLPASRKAKLPQERTTLATCVIGLLSYFEGDDALSAWTDKQLEQTWLEHEQASVFQTLYLAHPSSASDDLNQLAVETAHVCAQLIDNLPGKYASGLILALARRSRDKQQHVGDAIRSGLRDLDQRSRISVSGPLWSLDQGEKSRITMRLAVHGEGKLEPMSYLFPPITGGFTRELRSFLTDVTTGEIALDRKVVLAVLKDETATIAVIIAYDARIVEVPESTKQGLARRLAIAVAHARTHESKLRARVELTFANNAG